MLRHWGGLICKPVCLAFLITWHEVSKNCLHLYLSSLQVAKKRVCVAANLECLGNCHIAERVKFRGFFTINSDFPYMYLGINISTSEQLINTVILNTEKSGYMFLVHSTNYWQNSNMPMKLWWSYQWKSFWKSWQRG